MLVKLILKNIKKNIGIGILTIITLFVVIFSFSIFDYIYKNIRNNLILQTTNTENKNKFIIERKSGGFLTNIVISNSLDNLYNTLKKDKKIEKIYAFYKLKMASSIDIDFLGINFNTDVLFYATDKFEDNGNIIKLGISPTILNIYNTQVKDGEFFPSLDKNMLGKMGITLYFGKNSFFSSDKYITKKGKIEYIDPDFPFFGFTMSKKQVDKILKKMGLKNALKIYKIVGYVKNPSYIKGIKEKYDSFQIKSYQDIEKQVENKIKGVKYAFNSVKFIIYVVLLSFVIMIVVFIINKNKYTLKVLYYHGASKIIQFFIVIFELSFYFILSTLFVFFASFIFNKYIPFVNEQIEKKGIVNIHISPILYKNIFYNSFLLYLLIFIIIIFFMKIYDDK